MTLENVPAGVPMMHQILAYETVLTSQLCGMETLLRSMMMSSNINASEASAVAAILWVTHKDQFVEDHQDWLEKMGQIIDDGHANVHLILSQISTEEAWSGTPLGGFLVNASSDKRGKFWGVNKSDGMRLALIFKHGGTYMDSDILWLKSPLDLPGDLAVTAESPGQLNNALFRFPQGHAVVPALMKNFVDNFDGNKWGYQGPNLFNRMLLGDERVLVWTPAETSPVEYIHAEDMTNLTQASFQKKHPVSSETSYCIHIWHKLTKELERSNCEKDGSAYLNTWVGSLRKDLCPTTLDMVMKTTTMEKFHCKF